MVTFTYVLLTSMYSKRIESFLSVNFAFFLHTKDLVCNVYDIGSEPLHTSVDSQLTWKSIVARLRQRIRHYCCVDNVNVTV
jgi:hypothetical protein